MPMATDVSKSVKVLLQSHQRLQCGNSSIALRHRPHAFRRSQSASSDGLFNFKRLAMAISEQVIETFLVCLIELRALIDTVRELGS